MTTEHRIIGDDDIVAENTIMGDMTADKEQIVITDFRDHVIDRCTRMHGHIFTDRVSVTDFQHRFFTLVLVCCGGLPSTAKG